MPQPRKYETDADRYRAYRERKKERIEALTREAEIATATKAGKLGTKRGATFMFALDKGALCEGLVALRVEIDRRRKAAGVRRSKRQWNPDAVSMLELTNLIDFIEEELDRLMQ